MLPSILVFLNDNVVRTETAGVLRLTQVFTSDTCQKWHNYPGFWFFSHSGPARFHQILQDFPPKWNLFHHISEVSPIPVPIPIFTCHVTGHMTGQSVSTENATHLWSAFISHCRSLAISHSHLFSKNDFFLPKIQHTRGNPHFLSIDLQQNPHSQCKP